MKISAFQAVILAIFGVSLVAGLIVLATSKTKSKGSGVPVVVWGTLASEDFSAAIGDLTGGSGGLKITYVQKRADTFDQDLLEAIAAGRGPDVLALPQDMILRHKNKIAEIPYTTMAVRDFKDTFVQEGELFLDSKGIIAVPFALDPLVMFWNRDLLGNAGISKPPVTWDEFLTLAPKLTIKDKSLNILQSAVALGEFQNVLDAKEIVAAMLLQTGNPLVAPRSAGGTLTSTLTPASLDAVGALNFYTDFANPVKPDYSWNRSLPNSRNLFAAGNLAFYFGFASERSVISDKNPNLNFDVALFPQPKGGNVSVTFGKMWGLALLRNSHNVDAFSDIQVMTTAATLAKWSAVTSWPPVRRDLLSVSPADQYQSIYYNSAIRSRAWLDPNPAQSTPIFQNMIESITSGASETGASLDKAGQDFNAILQNL